MAVVTRPLIEGVELTIRKDVANAEVTGQYRINWSEFAVQTDLAHREQWELVGVDPNGTTTLFVGRSPVNGIRPDGEQSTQRTLQATIPWGDLEEDVNGVDEIALRVTLEPLLPTAYSALSPEVVVSSP